MDRKILLHLVMMFVLLLLIQTNVFAVEVRVAVFDGAKPFCYVDESGRCSGIFPELLRAVFQGDEYDLQFVTGLSFHDAYNRVLSGDIDIIPTLVMTEERQKLFSFSHEVILVSWSQVYLHPESPVKSVLDLRNKKIALMEDGQNGKNFINLMKSFDISFTGVYYPDFSKMTEDVLAQKVDGMVAFDGYGRTENRLKSSNILFSPNKAYYAVKKGRGEHLLSMIDHSVAEMKKDGTSVYYTEQKKLRFTDTVEVLPPWFFLLIAGFILCILIAILFSVLLRRRVRIIRDKLHDSEENYSRLFHAARDFILLTSFNGPDPDRVVDVNKSYCDRTGYSREDVLNQKIHQLMDSDDIQVVNRAIKQIDATGYSILESRLKTNGSGTIPVEVLSQKFESGGQTFVISICRDLSYRDDLKSALSAMEQKYTTIADYNYDWEVWRNDDNSYAYISPSCKRISGFSAAEFLENPELFRNIIHVDDRSIWDSHLKSVGKDLTEANELKIRIIRKDGELRWIQHDCKSITSSEGVSLGFRGNFRDVTEKMILEEQLVQKQKLESLGVLAGGIAHDFNNILAIIKGFSEIAQERFKDNKEVQEFFISIDKASERAVNLTEQILDFSRNRSVKKKPVQVSKQVREVLKLIKPTFPSNIEIRLDLENDSFTLADEGQMHRVIVNISTNARLAMPEGGRFSISLKKQNVNDIPSLSSDIEGQYCLELCFRDTGEGMDENVKSRIFDPFFTTRSTGDGTGLGLSVVHGLISEWGGHIRVESKPGEGTGFFIYLPIVQKIPENNDTLKDRSSLIKTGHVLVMDDEKILLKLIGVYLKSEGLTTELCSNPFEGLEVFRKEPDSFSLAVLDMTMPGMRGDKVALELKKIRPDLPVLICSGFSDNLDDENLPDGVDSFLQKPYGRVEFLNEVGKLLIHKGENSQGEGS